MQTNAQIPDPSWEPHQYTNTSSWLPKLTETPWEAGCVNLDSRMPCACRYSVSGIKLLYSDPIQAYLRKSHPLCKRGCNCLSIMQAWCNLELLNIYKLSDKINHNNILFNCWFFKHIIKFQSRLELRSTYPWLCQISSIHIVFFKTIILKKENHRWQGLIRRLYSTI